MYISLDWISDFVDLQGITPEQIADRLTMATAEVEGWEIIRRNVKGIFVGEVISAEKILLESGKTLTYVTVDCGKAGKFSSVCGAPNCVVGIKAPFAPVGAEIAGGEKIIPTEMAGHLSEGILCSAKEIGLSRWHEELFSIPRNVENGTSLEALIPEEDMIIEIDNKSLTHRPDLWGHYGFAREFAAIFERELKPLPQMDLTQFESLPPVKIMVDDLTNCPCYSCISLKMPNIPPAPVKMQVRLHALGQRTKDLMVDVTNYVMFELGQPTHAFDGDHVDAIRVATVQQFTGKEELNFITLDGQQRKMLAEDLMICNDDGRQVTPIGVAGVMGGRDSEIKPTTKEIYLESANFNAARIRRTAVRLDLRSDASQRFEKSQPPVNTRVATGRILQLLQESGENFNVTSRFSWDGDLKDAYRALEIPAGTLDRLAGISLPFQTVLNILHRLGFGANFAEDGRLLVNIPPFRSQKDISISEDIIEEVLRVYGYDQIPPQLPEVPIRPLHLNKALRAEHQARKLLAAAHGFTEVHNYSWMDSNWLAQIQYAPENLMEFRNPATTYYRFLRTSLMPTLLQLVGKNRGNRDHFRFFEIGNVYNQKTETQIAAEPKNLEGKTLPSAAVGRDTQWIGQCDERTHLAGVSYSTTAFGTLEDHYRAVKGALEDLGKLLHRPLSFVSGTPQNATVSGSAAPWMQDGYWVEVFLGNPKDGVKIGALGVLDGKLLQTVVPEGGQVVWFELEFYKLDVSVFPDFKPEPLAVYPVSWQDFSLVWDLDAGYAALEEKLAEFTHPLLKRREFLYCYKGKGLEKTQGSYTWRFWIGADDHTLSGEEIDDFRQKWLSFLQKEGIAMRA
ncbi:MAG: phenylalanine--tRNA ligase subunit beta [Planctomycetia bacterium]|nr:phenylalanine--tRNA ligase subunit beta [Planctomycetia bacterium]